MSAEWVALGTPDPVTEALVGRTLEGDEHAASELFERVRPRLLFYVRARLGPELAQHVEAADVVQEVLLGAYRSLSDFENRGPGAFRRWLTGIAAHRLRDLAQRYAAQRRKPPGTLLSGTDVLPKLAAEQAGPATEAAADEHQELLLEALAELPEEQRMLLLKRFLEELTLDEIAAQLDWPRTTVHRRLAEAGVALGSILRRRSGASKKR